MAPCKDNYIIVNEEDQNCHHLSISIYNKFIAILYKNMHTYKLISMIQLNIVIQSAYTNNVILNIKYTTIQWET